MNYLDVYSKCFADTDYSNHYHTQYDYAIARLKTRYERTAKFRVIDVGSGRGQVIKLLKSNFPNCEIVSVDLMNFHNIPVNNFVICDLSKEADRTRLKADYGKFDVLVNTDVLEHLDKSFIEDVIKLFSELSSLSILAIANHSDIVNGVELHTIQENHKWWGDMLSKYFKIEQTECVYEKCIYKIVCTSLFQE